MRQSMRTAGFTVKELKRIHRRERERIRERLAEFSALGRTARDEKLFEELAFCIFTAGASARMGLRSIDRVRPVLINGSLREIQDALKGAHRYGLSRGRYVHETREYLHESCGLQMRALLHRFGDANARRDFLAQNRRVRGIGYKEASHFLRNVGFSGYAILDKHVLNRLTDFGVIGAPKPPSTRNRYLEIEEKTRAFAARIGIDVDELDLLLWFTKTGEILK